MDPNLSPTVVDVISYDFRFTYQDLAGLFSFGGFPVANPQQEFTLFTQKNSPTAGARRSLLGTVKPGDMVWLEFSLVTQPLAVS